MVYTVIMRRRSEVVVETERQLDHETGREVEQPGS